MMAPRIANGDQKTNMLAKIRFLFVTNNSFADSVYFAGAGHSGGELVFVAASTQLNFL